MAKQGALPELGSSSPNDFARYTHQEWARLDEWYSFWVERWRRTMDFLRGQHWKTLTQIEEKDLPKWKEYPVAELVLANYADYMAQWLQSEVRFGAVPASPSYEDIEAANLAESVLAYLWDLLEMDFQRIELGAWLLATGNTALRAYWDTNTGNLLPLAVDGADGNMIPVDLNGNPLPPGTDPIMLDAGEINVEPLSPQFVRWVTGGRKIKSVMVGYLLDYDETEERFGKEVAEVMKYTTDWSGISLDLLSLDAPNIMPDKSERSLVVEHYFPRSYKHPSGLWWISSGTDLIVKPNPLPAGQVPIIPFRWIPVPGHPTFGVSPLWGMTKTNKLYEKTLAKQLEWMNKVIPKTLLKSGGGIKPGDFTKEPGQEVPCHAGAEPDFLKPPEMPATYRETREEIKDLHSYLGLYQFRRDKEPLPGTAERRPRLPHQLANQTEQVQLATINSRASWKRLGEVLLGYVANFYNEPRVISVVGQDRSYQWKEFKGADLQNLSATVKVDEVSLYPWQKQEMRDSVISLLNGQSGQILFTDAQGQLDIERVRKAVQVTGLDVALDTLDEDVLEARNEHPLFQNFQEGMEVPTIQPWNNHAAHLAEHVKLAKSLGFKSWPEEKQGSLLQHMGMHEEEINKAQQAQQEQQLNMEKQLREIRGQAESSQAIREAFGEELVQLITGLLGKALDLEKPTE